MSNTPSQIMVTLKKAQTYIHQPSGLRFEFDVPRIVTPEVAEYLYANAVKSVKTVSGNRVSREEIRLFEFAPVDDDLSDDEDEQPQEPETLASVLAKATPVPASTTSADPGAATVGGGDGQARSRARGVTAPKGGQASA